MLVKEGGFDVKEKSTPVNIRAIFDTNIHRSQSWLIRLMRILLVLCSETCQY